MLLGVDADSVKDRVLSPFVDPADPRPGTAGLHIHAYAVAQLLAAAMDGLQPLASTSQAEEYALLLAAALAGGLLGFGLRQLPPFLALLLLGNVLLAGFAQWQFARGLWVPVVPAMLAWSAAGLLAAAYMASVERSQRRFLMNLFARHVSPEVAREIWRQRDRFLAGGRLQPSRMVVSVLFADLENFTAVAEALAPEQLIDWMNRYTSVMADLVMQHGGMVDDYYGDAIKANFGVPSPHESADAIRGDALNAVGCALAMCRSLQDLNAELRQRDLPMVRIRVGISTGPVVAGCLGSEERMKYTTIGDTVNIAARLESFGKQFDTETFEDPHCRILVADTTVRQIGRRHPYRRLGAVVLKGKSEPVEVYTVYASV